MKVETYMDILKFLKFQYIFITAEKNKNTNSKGFNMFQH